MAMIKDTAWESRGIRGLVAGFLVLSGAAGLIYEVVWMRQLTLLFGSTVFAASSVLTAFMGGLALGSFLFGRWAARFASPILMYGLLEVGIGVYAFILPLIIEAVRALYAILAQGMPPSSYLFNLLRFVIATGLLLFPTTLMGGTLPVVSQWFSRREDGIGFSIGRLYALNTVGAVLGVVGAGFFLLPWAGMSRAIHIAVFMNLAIGFILISLFKRSGGKQESAGIISHADPLPTSTPRQQPISSGGLLFLLVVYGLSGLAAMAYEVLWTRVLVLILGSSSYAFTLMLATFLIGLGLGSHFISGVADRLRSPRAVFGLLEIGVGVAALWGLFQFEKLPWLYLSMYRAVSGNEELLLLGKFLLSALVILPSTLLMGAIFPTMVRICHEKGCAVGLTVGRAYGANTLGAIAGSFAAGLLMIPLLGLQASLTLLIGLNLTLGLAVLVWSREKVLVLSGAVAVGIVSFMVSNSPPSWNRMVMSSGVYQTAPVLLNLYPTPKDAMRVFEGYEELFYKEGWNSTLTVFRKPDLSDRPHIAMAIDGKIDASTSRDMSTQVLTAHLPIMVADRPRNVLVVGYASGVTAGSVLLYPVERMVVAEIEPAVIEASHYFDGVNHRPLEDRRVDLVLDDGRHYLDLTDDTFDVVISEPSNPWMSGPSKLFTREFFELGKRRLAPKGIFAQWVQMYGMKPEMLKALVRTFRAVFPEVLLFRVSEADLLLLGAEIPLEIDYQRVRQWMRRPEIRSDLERVLIQDPLDLLMKLKLGTREIEGYVETGPLNTDDNGLIEFEAPKTIYADTIAANIESLEMISGDLTAYIRGVGDAPSDQAELYLKLARKYLEEGNDRRSEALARKSLSLKESGEVYWLLGRIQAQQGFYLTARQHWKQALQLDPAQEDALLSLARYHQSHARFEEAARYLATAVEVHSGKPWPRYYNGINLFYFGSLEKAAHELEGFLKISKDTGAPHRVLARYYLFQIYERAGAQRRGAAHRTLLVQQLRELRTWRERDEGKKELDRLLKLIQHHGEQPVFHRTEQPLRVLVRQHVTEPLAHYYRGVSLFFLGYPEEAARELAAALDVLPRGDDSPRARYYLNLIASARNKKANPPVTSVTDKVKKRQGSYRKEMLMVSRDTNQGKEKWSEARRDRRS